MIDGRSLPYSVNSLELVKHPLAGAIQVPAGCVIHRFCPIQGPIELCKVLGSELDVKPNVIGMIQHQMRPIMWSRQARSMSPSDRRS